MLNPKPVLDDNWLSMGRLRPYKVYEHYGENAEGTRYPTSYDVHIDNNSMSSVTFDEQQLGNSRWLELTNNIPLMEMAVWKYIDDSEWLNPVIVGSWKYPGTEIRGAMVNSRVNARCIPAPLKWVHEVRTNKSLWYFAYPFGAATGRLISLTVVEQIANVKHCVGHDTSLGQNVGIWVEITEEPA